MIELPRAALKADELAQSAEFFGFGTNDLTQTTLGMSRDDTGAILDEYRARGVYVADPFASIDVEGVGCLVKLACEKHAALIRKSGWAFAVSMAVIRHLSTSSRLVA